MAMHRILLACLMSAACAAEAVPVLTISGKAEGLPPPPAVLSSWWNDTLVSASAWFGANAGHPVDAATLLRGGPSFRLAGWGVPREDGSLRPAVSGWWAGEVAAATADSIMRMVGGWPGYGLATVDGRLALTCASAPAATPEEPEPGIAVAIEGPPIAMLMRSQLGGGRDEEPYRSFIFSVIERMRIESTLIRNATTGAAQGWIDAGIPSDWFRPLDAAVLSRLPADAVGLAAVGIHGEGLVRALAALPKPIRDAIDAEVRQIPMPGLEARAIARACDGTWLAFSTPRTLQTRGKDRMGFLIRAPRTPVTDVVIGLLAVEARIKLPDHDQPTRIKGEEAFIARDEQEWLVADSAERITAWRAGGGGIPPSLGGAAAHDTRLVMACTDGVAAMMIDAWPVEAWPSVPLVMPPSRFSEELHQVAARPMPARPRTNDRLQAMHQADGIHRSEGRAHLGHLRCDLSGQLLPWVVPGLAIGWCCAQAQDQAGRVELRSTIDGLRALGVGALPDDLLTGLIAEDAALEARVLACLDAVSATRAPDLSTTFATRARSASLPLRKEDFPEIIGHVETLHRLSHDLAGIDPARVHAALLRAKVKKTGLGPAMRLPEISAARLLMRAGSQASHLGDPRAFDLMDRAWVIMDHSPVVIGSLVQISQSAMRDNAHLAWLAGSAPDARRMALWMEPPIDMASAWRGERLSMLSWFASSWLEMPQIGQPAGRPQPGIPLVGSATPAIRLPLLALDSITARSAADTAIVMRLYYSLEKGEEPASDAFIDVRSPLTDLVMPAIGMMRTQHARAGSRHALVRLAARLQQLANSGALPADHTAATAAIGPLQVPYGRDLIPLRYDRTSTGGFRLAADPTAPGWDASAWKDLVSRSQAGTRYWVDGKGLEVVIDPKADPAPVNDAKPPAPSPTNDF